MPATTTRTKSHETVAAPVGLTAAFKLISMDGHTSGAAASCARQTLPHAQRIIKLLQGELDPVGDSDSDLQTELDHAAREMHGHAWEEPETDPQLASHSAFHVGFAVCWLLMTSINGGGAR